MRGRHGGAVSGRGAGRDRARRRAPRTAPPPHSQVAIRAEDRDCPIVSRHLLLLGGPGAETSRRALAARVVLAIWGCRVGAWERQ
jgi:hypothetical protein